MHKTVFLVGTCHTVVYSFIFTLSLGDSGTSLFKNGNVGFGLHFSTNMIQSDS